MSSWTFINPSSLSFFQLGQAWHHQNLVQSDDEESDTESWLGDLNVSLDSEDDLDDSLLGEDGYGSDLEDLDGPNFLYNPRKSRLSPEFAAAGVAIQQQVKEVQEVPGSIPEGKRRPEDIVEGRREPENIMEDRWRSANILEDKRPTLTDDQRFNWFHSGQPIRINATGVPPATLPGTRSSISSDSLAFTMVYCSVFTLTLLYIAFKITMKWKKNRRRVATQRRTEVRCNHAACQEAVQTETILPYSGLGALWIPEMITIQTGRNPNPATAAHNSRLCNNQCERCKQLALPPPSYTKLFLEEKPPTYGDALLKMECSQTRESCQLSGCKLHKDDLKKGLDDPPSSVDEVTAPLMQDNARSLRVNDDQTNNIDRTGDNNSRS